ncbi:uncharacterized protein VTP21DRAFT_550 [Calcarisporiella thermophila]|uniref:uncharacterized protein n=1 Tax=Calcarisporiella thermophila TaxID=911321 RepID=UPI0037430384
MKIIDKINKALSEDRVFWSFEYFPPKTQQGVQNLFDRMERMYNLGPEFIDVTWAAGGSSSELTAEIIATAQSVYGLETCMHLTCTNMPKEKIDTALNRAKECGNQNILALRGDPPRGQEEWTACEGGFSYAVDLVRYIREKYGDYFCIGVAGYPEGHINNPDKEADLRYLKEKVDAGADFIITQLFFDTDIFLEFVDRCRAIGITCPIIPGILPIQNYNGFNKMTTLSKTIVPKEVLEALEPIKEDDVAVKEYGIKYGVEMCQKLMAHGIKGFHFYTLNLEKSTRLVLERLGCVAAMEKVRPLPWTPSLGKNRRNENVRPIFWRNRTKSYIARTETWDEFPNGRWGDSRSPAFGELDGYGVSLKHSAEECRKIWGEPASVDDLLQLFVRYCRGEISALPWSGQPLEKESSAIREKLVRVNELGYLTINSQPAVDGVRSNDKIYGWGPSNGYVYQKAYLEFFISPSDLESLIQKLENDPYATYHAVNRQGDLRTNASSDHPTAVTWGVFPGKEIVQPTIVEHASFLAWKDEAFELWQEWAKLYPAGSKSRDLIERISNEYYLINIVHNDYRDFEGIWRLVGVEAVNGVEH